MERIEKLRTEALDYHYKKEDHELHYLFYRAKEKLSDLPEIEQYAEAFYTAFCEMTPRITEGELIVARSTIPLEPDQKIEWDNKYAAIAEEYFVATDMGMDSHMAIDYDLVLTEGVNGIIKRVENYIEKCDDEEKLAYYKACKRCLQAVIKHAENYSIAALELSKTATNPQTKAELEVISKICKKVPANPAESFYEAVQSTHFITHCITYNPLRRYTQQFQLGRPDRYLFPYYEKDIKSGKITKEFAQLLLDCFGIKINTRVPSGVSSGYMVGGCDSEGNIVANDLTEMLMQVVDDIRLVYPAVGLCYTEGMDTKYLTKACEILSKGHSHPAIFNDDIIRKGLIGYGVPENEAGNYIHSTCVEITPIAASNVWVASPYTNMAQLLLDEMDREYSSFDELMSTLLKSLDERIKANIDFENNSRVLRKASTINPLLSSLVNDCLERGLDIDAGGARYNWTMPSFVGMANLVDSLFAIKKLVFDEKKLTLVGYKKILEENFEGNEVLRQHILNNIYKYGNDIDEIDSYYTFLTEHIVEECKKHGGPYSNGNLIPSVFCWIKHEMFGRETIATPDGRLGGFPLGDGSGPCQGREMNGPTASVLSSTKWDHSKFIGGVAVNLKFSKAALGANSIETMMAIIKTYLKRGGFETQINVIDNETLIKAQKNPEQYKDLVVRIGGYSDYFVRLSEQMQSEVILRTTHNV